MEATLEQQASLRMGSMLHRFRLGRRAARGAQAFYRRTIGRLTRARRYSFTCFSMRERFSIPAGSASLTKTKLSSGDCQASIPKEVLWSGAVD